MIWLLWWFMNGSTFFNNLKYLKVNVPKVSQVEHQVKFYLCFDGIKTYSLFL